MTAFEKSARRKIFYGMALLFALVAPAVLLYSRGYLVDVRGWGLVPTGGVFVKTVQPGTKVRIDSDFSRETSFISHGALIVNLAARRYAVRVEKDGYRSWQKIVRVSGEEVLEFRNVLLPPATITPSAVFNTRRTPPGRLTALAGRPEVAVESKDPTRPMNVFVVNPRTGLAPTILIKVATWVWDEASRTFFIGRRLEGRMQWWRLAMTEDGSGREEAIAFRGLPAGFSAERISPHPSDPLAFYFFAGGGLFLQGRSSVPVPIAEQVHAYAVTQEHLYFISRNGFFAVSDLNGAETRTLGRQGLLLDPDRPASIVASSAGDIVVRDAAEGLFLYQPGRDEELELVAGNIGGVDFSAKGDRMLFWDDHRLWIYWLKDNSEQPFDLARTRRQIFYSDDTIRRAFLDAEGAHVFFATDRGIRMTEVDDRASVNAYDLVESPVGGFLLDKERLTLYWTSGSVLYRAQLE